MTEKEFKILFDTYFESVRSFIYYRCGDTEMATEVGQETFLKIWEKRLTPDTGKEKALLFKIASNVFISRIRKHKTALNYRKSMLVEIEEETPEDKMEYEELKDKYESALALLTDKQRQVFLLSRIENVSYHDMSQQLHISVKAVEKRMSQALAALRKALL